MWGFQSHFRRQIEGTLEESLKVVGVEAEPTVFLIGVLTEGGTRHPLCIEPEDGPIVPADFDGLQDRAAELLSQDPDSKMRFSDDRLDKKKHEEFLHRAYGLAIREIFDQKLGPGHRFSIGLPTPVEEHLVFAVVGLPERVLMDAPQLTSERGKGAFDRYRVTRSLIHGVVDQVLRLTSKALYLPDAGADLDGVGDTAEIVLAAARALAFSATLLSNCDIPTRLFDGLNRLATARYERRVGSGALLLAEYGSEHVKCSITLGEPVSITETRTLRKLLEISSHSGESLLSNGHAVYGLGQLQADYPKEPESVFQILVGDGFWELRHTDLRLATVRYGMPRLPAERLERGRFDDVCQRVLGHCDSEALWQLAMSAADAEHGTMLVVSADAPAEAARLECQALTIKPASLEDSLVRQIVNIDGAVLVDPSGCCHAIGVILDGTVTGEGDRSRGARYNSAIKYQTSATTPPTVILLVSEDGMINILPDLRPRMKSAERDTMLIDLREAAAREPVDAERFYKAYGRVQANKFYFSPGQIEEINTLVSDHWRRRIAQGARIRVFEPALAPDPEMNDKYLID